MAGRGDGRSPEQPAEPAPDAAEQARCFEQGVRLFQARDFAAARQIFQRAACGPALEIAHAARQRARMCEQRLAGREPALASAEDHYNYAVLLLNERRWEQAEAHLQKALAENPAGDHLYYALALCRCWRGDFPGAAQYMRRAIELQPSNLIAARNDPDFAWFAQQPPLAEILNPERNRTP
jgi:tetratricopeptide (TPR) repeat protein